MKQQVELPLPAQACSRTLYLTRLSKSIESGVDETESVHFARQMNWRTFPKGRASQEGRQAAK